MKRVIIPFLVLSFMMSCSEKPIQYPPTKKGDVKDTYFGTEVEDPYRWLEDDNSAETADWVKAENKLTFDYLEKLPFRDKIKSRLTELWDFSKIWKFHLKKPASFSSLKTMVCKTKACCTPLLIWL